ncbi:MAG: aminoglycoside phosphotransferase [Sciscionella sp.]
MTLDDADALFRDWMRDNLLTAAGHFQVTIVGEPVFGWLDRSISVGVTRDGAEYWLRVVSEDPQWVHLDFWTGNQDATILTTLPKPTVLDTIEWDEHRRQRAELMTRLPGRPCSPTDALRADVALPPHWWSRLRDALTTLSRTPTTRVNVDQDRVDDRVHAAFGDQVTLRIEHWETAHGDLHWANLLRPELGILDWEHWGHAPAGTDAATLYCYSLLAPATARTVHTTFAGTLDTPAGRIAQLYVIARLLHRARRGEHPDLVEPLTRHAQALLS